MATNKDIRGWTKASFFNPATGDVVQVNRIIPDFSSWEPDIIQTADTVGSLYGGKSFALQVGSPDVNAAKKAMLQQWSQDGTLIQAVVYNPHGKNILWYTAEELLYTPAAGTDARKGVAVHTCWMDFEGAGSEIYQPRNLIADAFPRIFPVAGAQLTYSISTATAGTLTLYFKDYAGTTLQQKQISTVSGRNSVTDITPAGTYQITVDEPNDAADQALRTDGSAEYTAT